MNLKKKDAYIRISGGWPVTQLGFERKEREQSHDSLILRDENEISHKITIDKEEEVAELGDF